MQVKFLTINEINGVQQAIFEEFFGFVSEDVIWILLCVELQTEHSASKDIHGKGCSNTADKTNTCMVYLQGKLSYFVSKVRNIRSKIFELAICLTSKSPPPPPPLSKVGRYTD